MEYIIHILYIRAELLATGRFYTSTAVKWFNLTEIFVRHWRYQYSVVQTERSAKSGCQSCPRREAVRTDDHWVFSKRRNAEINWGIKLAGLRNDFDGLVRHALLICLSAGKYRFLVGRDCSESLKAPQWQCAVSERDWLWDAEGSWYHKLLLFKLSALFI